MQPTQNRPIFSVWSAIVRAPLFSGELYRDVARNWRGIGLKLLIAVQFITWLALGIKLHISINRFAPMSFRRW